jgi:hypothetical protein
MTIDWVDQHTEERIATGDLSMIAPWTGFSEFDKTAIKRSYMLPCDPQVVCAQDADNPANVQTVLKILTLDMWSALIATMFDGDSPANGGGPRPGPGDTAPGRLDLLNAVARYPYFCGEKGRYASVEEACRRELAAVIAHGTQETGNGGQLGSLLFYTREQNCFSGNCKQYMPPPCGAGSPCIPPFQCRTDCADPSQYYYGRGLKQLTDYYNYAGFSGAYFGNVDVLLQCPDRVGSKGGLIFTSGLWFYMTTQPPKPSIHDVIIGNYAPAGCTDATACKGIRYDATNGVDYPFGVTISVINGGVECGPNVAPQYKATSENRSALFKTLLTAPQWFDATPVGTEVSMRGCANIANGNPFAGTPAADAPQLWLETAGGGCRAVGFGVNPPLNVLAEPIVEGCLDPAVVPSPLIDCGDNG